MEEAKGGEIIMGTYTVFDQIKIIKENLKKKLKWFH